MTRPLRVVVIEDSLTVRKRIVEVLSEASGIEVVGEASDGPAGIELCERLRPDVVTLDMVLPGMSGLEVTEHLMAYCPTPILIVSASTNRAELFDTYEALAAGAVDVLDKPTGGREGPGWPNDLVRAVRIAARVRVIMHPRARLRRPQGAGDAGAGTGSGAGLGVGAAEPGRRGGRGGRGGHSVGGDAAVTAGAAAPWSPPDWGKPRARRRPRLVAIGASTGGPGAILTILKALPRDFPLPVLIVLHVSETFGGALASWLEGQVALPVRVARDGEPLPPPGRPLVLFAPPGRHLVLADGVLRLSDAEERNACRPSVDVLFESVADEIGARVAACLLTGMGRDGAAGLLAVARAGGETIAQDEATSVIFGMPGEAVRLGAARRVLPLDAIAPALVELSRIKPHEEEDDA